MDESNVERDQTFLVSYEKKKVALEFFELWDEENQEYLIMVERVLEHIYENINNILNDSLKKKDFFINFFKTTKLLVNKKIHLKKSLLDLKNTNYKNPDKENPLIKFTKEFETDFFNFQRFFQTMDKKIDKDLINAINQKLLPEEKKIKELSQKLLKIKDNIYKSHKEIKKFHKKFIKKLKKSMELNKKYKLEDSNMFDEALDFFCQIKSISSGLITFSKNFNELYNLSIILDQNINQILKMAIKNYISILKHYLGEDKINFFKKTLENVKQLSFDNLSENNFKISKIIKQGDINLILQEINEKEFNLESLGKFFKKCILKDHQDIISLLYLHLFKGKIISGEFSQNTDDIFIFLTVDYHYSIYSVKNKMISNHLTSIPMQDTEVFIDNKKSVKFKFVEKGWFFNSKHEFNIELENNEMDIWCLLHNHSLLILNPILKINKKDDLQKIKDDRERERVFKEEERKKEMEKERLLKGVGGVIKNKNIEKVKEENLKNDIEENNVGNENLNEKENKILEKPEKNLVEGKIDKKLNRSDLNEFEDISENEEEQKKEKI